MFMSLGDITLAFTSAFLSFITLKEKIIIEPKIINNYKMDNLKCFFFFTPKELLLLYLSKSEGSDKGKAFGFLQGIFWSVAQSMAQ